MSDNADPAQATQTRPYSRELVASVVGPVVLVAGTGTVQLIGYIVGIDPDEWVGLAMVHVRLQVKAADWLIDRFPALAELRRAPHNLRGAEAFLAALDLPEVFDVPRHPTAGPWLPAADPE